MHKGIPYGHASRWNAPSFPTPWTTPFQATSFGACCPQHESPFFVAEANTAKSTSAEDCLSLNIWSPLTASDSPVLVFIHGGGFEAGCSDRDRYHGLRIAGSTNTVVVTINYRLGMLGFLAGRGLKGNFGIMDQQLALMWIQKNIKAFGGDPTRVTIDGQSAGAMSVATHLALPSTRSLKPFRAAIIQSDPVLIQYRKLAEQDAQFDTVSSAADCGFASDRLACMKNLPVSTILNAQKWGVAAYLLNNTWQNVIHKMPWAPTIDGSFLTETPSEAFQSGNFYKVPVMLGTTANETVGFIPLVLGQGPTEPILAATFYQSALNMLFGERIASKVRSIYPNDMKTSTDAIGRLLTDFVFTCSTLQSASWLSRYVPTFAYQMSHSPNCDPNNYNWKACDGRVCHSADIDFVFHTVDLEPRGNCKWTPQETELSWHMLHHWTNFTATPELFSLIPRFSSNPSSGVSRQFDIPLSYSTGNWDSANCKFWSQVVAGVI